MEYIGIKGIKNVVDIVYRHPNINDPVSGGGGILNIGLYLKGLFFCLII